MFNLLDIYGDSQLDPVTTEYVLVYVAGMLARDRAARRAPNYRVRPGENKDSGKALKKHAWNQKQLAALAMSSLERGKSYSLEDLTEVYVQL